MPRSTWLTTLATIIIASGTRGCLVTSFVHAQQRKFRSQSRLVYQLRYRSLLHISSLKFTFLTRALGQSSKFPSLTSPRHFVTSCAAMESSDSMITNAQNLPASAAEVAAASDSGAVSEKLVGFVQQRIVFSLQQGWGDVSEDENLRERIGKILSNHILAISMRSAEADGLSVKQTNRLINQNAYMLSRHFAHTKGNLSNLPRDEEDVYSLIKNEHLRDARNTEVFDTIRSHHQQITKVSWTDAVAAGSHLNAYASAAVQMGAKPWVRNANEWMKQSIFRFFCRGVAKKVHSKAVKKLGSLNSPLVDLYNSNWDYLKNLCDNLMETVISETHTEYSPIRVLDVGSCYNPLASPVDGESVLDIDAVVPLDAFQITPVDLYPANPSVFQCDFLNVQFASLTPTCAPDTLAPPETPPLGVVSEPIVLTESNNETLYRRVVSLVPEYYDAVTMSLVLSYLPSPQQRVTMIRNARKALRPPAEKMGPTPHRTSLLAIVEKISVFGGGPDSNTYIQEWKDTIARLGFEPMSHQPMGKPANSIGFLFRATDDAAVSEDADLGLYTRTERLKAQNIPGKASSAASETGYEEEPNAKRARLDMAVHNYDFESGQSPPGLKTNCWFDRPLHVAILGCGIGGSALAVALKKLPLDFVTFTVYEKDAHFNCRKQGYALTMQQGLSALRALGIDQEVKRLGVVSSESRSLDAQGEILGVYGPTRRIRVTKGSASIDAISEGEVGSDRVLDSFSPYSNYCMDSDSSCSADETAGPESSGRRRRHNVHVSRQLLRDLLVKQIDPRVIKWGHKLERFDCNPSASDSTRALTLHFANGVVETADLLVAADGIYSSVRQQLAPDKTLKYLGLLVILGISQNPPLESGSPFKYRKTQWLDGITRVFSMPFDKEKTMWQMSFPVDSEAEARDISASAERLYDVALQRCGSWHAPLADLLRRTDMSMISGHPVYDLDPLVPCDNTDGPNKSRGSLSRIVSSLNGGAVMCIGDAAHPMSPFKGQGANQALADAVSLASHIASLYRPTRHASHSVEDGADGDKQVPFEAALDEALRSFVVEMASRSSPKVSKSRSAAHLLHSPRALQKANITRAAAAAAEAEGGAAVTSERK